MMSQLIIIELFVGITILTIFLHLEK